MSGNNVDLSLFSQDHYLAFALSEKTRQELIKAIGARFEVRVCHHVTLHYDIPEPGEPTTLDYYMANFGGFVTTGYMVTPHQVVIAVSGGLNDKFRPIYDETNPRDVLHITYERDRTVKDGASAIVFSNEVPYVFHPLSITLDGTFQMLPKNDKTPTEINQAWVDLKIAEVAREQKENYSFTNSYFHGNQKWVALNVGANGIPAAFLYRNKNGPSRTVERGDPQFNALFNAWREWGFHEVEKIKNHTRLVNPPQPAELSEHAGLCSEVALPTLGDQRCVIGQAKHRFVTDRSLLTTPGTWMITGYTSEGRPISFVGMSLLGLGLEVGMDLKEGSDYMKLYHLFIGYLVQWCEKNQVRLPADARYPTYNERSRHRSTCSEECRMNML